MTAVSVLQPIYKPHYLAQAIDSVLAQTLDDWELWCIIDDSPYKGCLEIVAGYDDPRIHMRVIHVPERRTCRYATVINETFPFTTGRYISYLTDDDSYHHDRLERMVSFLDRGVDIVYGTQTVQDAAGNVLYYRRANLILQNAAMQVDMCSVMHRRQLFEEARGWDDAPEHWAGADAEFWRRLARLGYEFVPLPDHPTDMHRQHDLGIQARVSKGLDPWHTDVEASR